MKTTATREQVLKAIESVNTDHGYKIELNRDETKGKYFFFTLKSKSGIPGARTSWNGKNLACASWHSHGYIFDEIFKLNPSAIIYSNKEKITVSGGNWIDKNIGSIVNPCYFSETSIL